MLLIWLLYVSIPQLLLLIQFVNSLCPSEPNYSDKFIRVNETSFPLSFFLKKKLTRKVSYHRKLDNFIIQMNTNFLTNPSTSPKYVV